MNEKFHRIVIKIGSSTLTDQSGNIDPSFLESLASQVADVCRQGKQVLVVTSGSIRAGMGKMGLQHRPSTIPEKQAAAAIGQGYLMQMYIEAFARHDLTVAQALLTRQDFGDRKRYLNARNALRELLHIGVVPIVNENDTVAIDEIQVGDNDTLAALVAANLGADLLILLSDVPGLYNANPEENPSAEIIPIVKKIDAKIRAMAGGAGSIAGTGGMRTKIEAASIAMRCGVTMVIAYGRQDNIITDIVNGKQIGTTFLPARECLRSRKRWIAFGATSKGEIIVNEGAREMIREKGKSLLAAGITEVSGDFQNGDMVNLVDQEGNQFARGFVNYNATEIDRIKGRRSSEIEKILGYKDFDEIIHRDNMVLRK